MRGNYFNMLVSFKLSLLITLSTTHTCSIIWCAIRSCEAFKLVTPPNAPYSSYLASMCME